MMVLEGIYVALLLTGLATWLYLIYRTVRMVIGAVWHLKRLVSNDNSEG
jgi:hypothetical protein